MITAIQGMCGGHDHGDHDGPSCDDVDCASEPDHDCCWAYDGPQDGTACTAADGAIMRKEGMECGEEPNCGPDPDHHPELTSEERDAYYTCYESSAYRSCERDWEDNHPMGHTCQGCLRHLQSMGSEDWSVCIAPTELVPACPGTPDTWPSECQTFSPSECCGCLRGDCSQRCDDLPHSCHGILSCPTGGPDGGPVCDFSHGGMGPEGEPMGGDGTDWTDPGAGGDACATCMAACANDADCMASCTDDAGSPCMGGGGDTMGGGR